MHDVEQYAFDEVCKGLASIEDRIVSDIYVLSFYIEFRDEDPRYPTLQVGYNTRSRVETCLVETCGHADAVEVKWNFAFWLQNVIAVVGEPETDGQRKLKDVLTRQNLWYTDDEEDADFDACMQKAEAITGCFVAMCVRVAQELHATGFIENRFGRPIPVIIHELEYYDQIAAQTAAANPTGLASEFVDWISSMYKRPA